jgi:hypothetical protein
MVMGCYLVDKFLTLCYRKWSFSAMEKGGFHRGVVFLVESCRLFCFYSSDMLSFCGDVQSLPRHGPSDRLRKGGSGCEIHLFSSLSFQVFYGRYFLDGGQTVENDLRLCAGWDDGNPFLIYREEQRLGGGDPEYLGKSVLAFPKLFLPHVRSNV